MANISCEKCKCFDRWPDDQPQVPSACLSAFNEDEEEAPMGNQGECRRYAPGPISDTAPKGGEPPEALVWRWPVVNIRHWCGEFEKAKLEGR